MYQIVHPQNGLQLLCYLLVVLICSCNLSNDKDALSQTFFEEISGVESGILFANNITENDSLTYFKFPYIYMGGGVAIGDINNDGLSDIFLTGNMVDNQLYLNKGNMKFENITSSANIKGDQRWYTGATMTDINNDGFLDIYLSVSGMFGETRNQLFINNGDATFTEKANEFGIDDASNSIQSTFFDYDNDGDIDLFVANYPLVGLSQGNLFYAKKMKENELKESGHLYRNNGSGTFTDVTNDAGVQNFGLTLGLVAMDFNKDGWTDLYLSNDFNVPDYFYLNNGDGTFQEIIKQATGHTSMFGMGIDASDFNNDGLVDLIQADMSPEDYVRSKVNMASMSPQNFNQGVSLGFHYQYMQNSLQVNSGIDPDNLPIMSEISRLAGVASTDWSWSTLFADLDNDGWKDIYITNGMKRDVNDNDVNNRSEPTSFKQAFKLKITDYASQPLSNYVYQNQGDFTFKKKGKDWNLDFKGFSNGMSYGDLDNDGDLDLVINNIDQPASLFQNDTRGSDYLRVSLKGTIHNPIGLGAKVTLESNGLTQYQELTLTRGFQSSVEPVLHFGLGVKPEVSTLHIVWPDGKEQFLNHPTTNTLIVLDYSQAQDAREQSEKHTQVYTDITASSNLEFSHSEDLFDDYALEPLLPYKYSMMGPGLSKGDINGDGLEDFYIGGAAEKQGALFIQKTDATFVEIEGPWLEDFAQEDVAAVFSDFDNDGDQDLYVVSHGNQFQDHTDRLYVNLGTGFVKSSTALPKVSTAGKAIAICDFDHDGLKDIFIGGRNTPGKYPFPANSLLLKNLGGEDEALRFENATTIHADGLHKLGMITDAVWADIDGDEWEDLILSGEWMPLTIFKNDKGRLVNKTAGYGLGESQGWWYTVRSLDVDQDGDLDLVAGNLGLNYKYKATMDSPFEVYSADFDENGKNDIVLSYKKEEKAVPLRGRECSAQQIPAIGHRYKTFREFAEADLRDIYGDRMLREALHYQSNTFAHAWFENRNGNFSKSHALPIIAQFSTVSAIEPIDYNGDEYPDLMLAGNLYQAEVETPRSDAGLGLVLEGSSKGFKVISPRVSGLLFRDDIKAITPIRVADNTAYLLGANNGILRLIQKQL
ncbi:MAG: hypothetical protein ACI9FN_000452 [Saprospiraceae bacterium]|jgi:hypothetical protein